MTQRGSGCTQRRGSELVLQYSTPSLVLPMHLCAADISQIYNSMEAVPRVLCCSKACMPVVLKTASCFMCGRPFYNPSSCPPCNYIYTCMFLHFYTGLPHILHHGDVVLLTYLERKRNLCKLATTHFNNPIHVRCHFSAILNPPLRHLYTHTCMGNYIYPIRQGLPLMHCLKETTDEEQNSSPFLLHMQL